HLADPAGLLGPDGLRLAGLAAGALPGPGRGPGLLDRHGGAGGQRLRDVVPARRGVVDPRWAGRRLAATPYEKGPGLGLVRRRPRRGALLRGFVLRPDED